LSDPDLLLGLGTALLLFLCVVVLLVLNQRLREQNDALTHTLQDLEQLNRRLRAQRHDYLNHLQVVYGMLELEEYGELQRYLEPLYQDMVLTGKALRTAQPAVNALLMAKLSEAQQRDIRFAVEVHSPLEHCPTEPWELCRVLANVLDNAMCALESRPKERKLWLELFEDREEYRFEVANNGPPIPPEDLPKLFTHGFSTKKEEGHGTGLAIVAQVLKEHGGRAEVHSTAEETRFILHFPKKKGSIIEDPQERS